MLHFGLVVPRVSAKGGFTSAFHRETSNTSLLLFPMPDVHHETVFYSGHVQGVGFRYSVLQVAREFEVTGFVRNLVDGRVQMEVEGTQTDVSAFVDAVQERLHGYVRKVERAGAKRAAQFIGFTIK